MTACRGRLHLWLPMAVCVLLTALWFRAPTASAQSPTPQTAPAQTAPAPATPPKSPFGVAPPSAQQAAARPAKPAAEMGTLERWSAWLTAKQAEYHRDLVKAVRGLKTDNVLLATWTLALLSFLYGVFHAAGPGHGKAIISSYVLANERTARRGVLIAFMSSGFQALSAIAIVGVMSIALRSTGPQIQATEGIIERVSAVLVMAVGAWLLFTQLRALATGKPAHAHAHGHAHSHAPHAHAHASHGTHDHGHHHAHDHKHASHAHDADCDHCGHQHLPGPEQLEQGWSWKRALALSFAVGIRPCTGAILVLVFALTQGLFWAGVFATFAMALGTAITVSALAVLAVVSRDWAARIGGNGGRWMDRVYTLAGLLGAGAVLLLGLLLFMGSFGPARAF